jgi:hypothetical protein
LADVLVVPLRSLLCQTFPRECMPRFQVGRLRSPHPDLSCALLVSGKLVSLRFACNCVASPAARPYATARMAVLVAASKVATVSSPPPLVRPPPCSVGGLTLTDVVGLLRVGRRAWRRPPSLSDHPLPRSSSTWPRLSTTATKVRLNAHHHRYGLYDIHPQSYCLRLLHLWFDAMDIGFIRDPT